LAKLLQALRRRAIAQRTGVSKSVSLYHSLGGSRGRGLLCLAPQLVFIFALLVARQEGRVARRSVLLQKRSLAIA